jgi:flagella basal body P-ring formation protein FlgA
MTVSTKTPTNRASGSPSGGSGGRPIPAPRVVNNRRIRTGGVLLAVLLLVLGAALSALALLSATKTSSYLAVARPVQIGSQITAGDLTTVQFSGGQGLSAIPASQINSVIGRRAAVPLLQGTLLSKDELTDKTLLPSGSAEVGLSVRKANLPVVKPGDQVTLVSIATSAGAPAGNVNIPATIIDVGTAGSDGNVAIHVAVLVSDAPTVVALGASGGLGIYLKAQD